MKKLLLTLSLLGFCAVGKSWGYEVPGAQTSQQASISYGGVKYSSSAFSASVTSVTYSSITAAAYPQPTSIYPQGAFIFYGVEFSSGPCSLDYVEVWDSSSTAFINEGSKTNAQRYYNVAGSTASPAASGSNGNTCSGFVGPLYPVRHSQGLFFKPSSSGYNMIRLYYWKPD